MIMEEQVERSPVFAWLVRLASVCAILSVLPAAGCSGGRQSLSSSHIISVSDVSFSCPTSWRVATSKFDTGGSISVLNPKVGYAVVDVSPLPHPLPGHTRPSNFDAWYRMEAEDLRIINGRAPSKTTMAGLPALTYRVTSPQGEPGYFAVTFRNGHEYGVEVSGPASKRSQLEAVFAQIVGSLRFHSSSDSGRSNNRIQQNAGS